MASSGTDGCADVGQFALPIMVIDLDDLTVRAISTAALELLGRPSVEVTGRPVADLFGPDEGVGAALQAVKAGVVDFYRAHRRLDVSDGSTGLVTVWVRVAELGGGPVALVELARGVAPQHSPLVEHLGREPLEMAIGTTDSSWLITSISTDVEALLGLPPTEVLGRPLLGAVRHDDVARLLEADLQAHEAHSVALRVSMRDAVGGWTRLCCVLTSMQGAAGRSFILLPDPEPATNHVGRVSQLERHLWRIAAEVEASGVLQRIGTVPEPARFPQMGELSARQWEVLSRLLRGDRVPTIATELFVSQSTVRHHLSAIFERFGVHSQVELLALLRKTDESPD